MGRRIGVGLYALAGVYGQKDEKAFQTMLEYAANQGVDFYDMAESYGHAEAFAGKVLKPYRDSLRIATKVSLTDDGAMDCSYEHIIHACKQSLQRLGMDSMDLYQIHYDDPHTSAEETVQALEYLKKDGLISAYGLGHLPYHKVKEFIDVGHPETLMIEFNPLCINQYNKYANLCQDYDIKLLTMGTTGRGLLTGKIDQNTVFDQGDIRRIDPLFRRGKLDTALRIVDRIKEASKRYNRTPVQVALNWVIHKPYINRALVGPSSVIHLKENLGSEGWTLTTKDMSDLNAYIKEEHERLANTLREEIEYLLREDINHDDVIADLVYVLEALIEDERLDESKALPLFGGIMALKKSASAHNIIDIKRQIRGCMKG